ncbi:hypothetical protein BO71DRAFT_402132 [Aspergillus ellipticus CBS 707.79]|uniref:SP-RING-type domain-containing protein n=1 Tax=Aspergillus ellipticus CBS 707.79 TaxID=1448320 RepID=A0A319EHV3_9EURO|nr:hypothetical protein BO71DRAFT_402132 [Aspergillus ellipticus CBS 707.79]
MYVFLNEEELFVRRRQHNGKDLPLDLTELIREGPNTLTIHLIRSNAEMRDLVYAMALEILSISILDNTLALAETLPASESKNQILRRIAPDTDDEISVVSDDLVINLVDPFTARIFNRPVRSRFCTHQECFDHETFVRTRASTSRRRTLQEDWRCPICKKDARPQNLLIDGFLAEVHESLSKSGQLDEARAITVKRDGSWTLKAEAETSTDPTVASGSGSGSGSGSASTSTLSSNPVPATPSPSTSNSAKRKATDPAPFMPASQRLKLENRASDARPADTEPNVIVLD